jgi:CO/xanthine dehydrogenase FAD-binding subunit
MPSLNATGYLRPASPDDALAALGEGAVAVAGGTAVILHPPPGTRTLVDLSDALPSGITAENGGFRIGAMTTLSAMLEHPELGAVYDGVLARMLALVGSPLLRNAATIGGHLGRGRLSDVIPVLIAFDARVTVYDGTTETMDLERYYAAGLHRARALVTDVVIPARPAGSAAGFEKVCRTHFDLAMLNGAARVTADRGVVSEARIVVGETPALGNRVPAAEAELVGKPLDAGVIAAAADAARETVVVATDSRASAEYRHALVGVVVTRCLREAAGHLGGPR